MKTKTTKKEIMSSYDIIIPVGYCALQHLLRYENPRFYTTRIEGWAADIYDCGHIALVTGYAPFGNRKTNWKLTREYDKKAEKILKDYSLLNNVQQQQIGTLLEEYLKKATAI